MRFAMIAAAVGAACLAVPAQAAPIFYGFVGSGTTTEFYHNTGQRNIYAAVKSGVIFINPAPGSSTFSSVTTELGGTITTTINATIVADVLTLSYDRYTQYISSRERTHYDVTATFQPGVLQGGFPTVIDFSTVVSGTVGYHYFICGPNCDGMDFAGSLTALQAIPEPATWAMLIMGFGAIGATVRRRQVRVGFA